MRKIIKTTGTTAVLYLLFISVHAQQKLLRIKPLNITQLPQNIKYEGILRNAISWTDNTGDNIVITTETGSYQNKKIKHEMDGADAEVFAYLYQIKSDSIIQRWKVYDFVADCPLDIEASFVKNTLQVTDLDNNGIAEVWLMYYTACRGDVSPLTLKIIMYEGKQKYAIRGLSKVFEGTDDKGVAHYAGGGYKYDEAFTNGPKEFLDFAKKLWKKNITPSLE